MVIPYVLLLVSVVIDTIKNIYYNSFGNNRLNNTKDALLFNTISCVGSVVFFLIIATSFQVSKFSFFLSVVFAVVTAGAQYLSLVAMSLGPMSYSVLFTYLSMLIPTLFGVICYSQPISILQIIGLILMVITFVMSVEFNGTAKVSAKWYFVAIGSFVAWGLVGVLQQIQQNSLYKDELDSFLLWSFIFSTMFFVLLLLINMLKDKDKATGSETQKLSIGDILFIIAIGAIIGLINKINLYLSGVITSIIFFPIVNGGVIILSSLAAIFIFRERLTKRQMVGLVTGVISTCLLGM